jgi:nicotinamidase-related amidase
VTFQVAGDPHAWPRDGKTPCTACAVIVVDMQHDYCSPGYSIARAGYGTRRLSEPIEHIQRVLAAARRSGVNVIYRVLRSRGIRHLALCGNTIDVCVHSTLRAAVDLGYECLLLADCCGAVNDGLHTWAVESVKIENGVFGTVARAQAFIDALLKG